MAQIYSAITYKSIELQSYLNPLTFVSLLVSIFKKWEVLGLTFFWCDVTTGRVKQFEDDVNRPEEKS